MESCAPPLALYVLEAALLAALFLAGWLGHVAWNRGKVIEGMVRRAELERRLHGARKPMGFKAPRTSR